MFKKIIFGCYIIVVFLLFFYSFTQVDLNLTLSRVSWYQTVEKSFQYIGYFNRPLSSALFISLLILLTMFWLLIFRLAIKQVITRKEVWTVLIISTVILMFAYNAFSYDIFNYIFYAKIFTYYHQNPYLHKALDFPQDHMLTFMRWTHVRYPYGPVWLGITIPLSYLGLQYFLPTFFLFKFLAAGSFLGTCYFLEKISHKVFGKQVLENLIFFALNPLVLIESLVSGHLDIVMVFFAVIAVWFLWERKWVWSIVLLIISTGVKFATGFLLPIFVYYFVIARSKATKQSREETTRLLHVVRNDVSQGNLFLVSACLMLLTTVLESYWSGNFQPWYLLIIFPFASFLSTKYYIIIPTVIVSFLSLCEYLPFLYLGNWNPPVPTILASLTFGSVSFSIFATILYAALRRLKLYDLGFKKIRLASSKAQVAKKKL